MLQDGICQVTKNFFSKTIQFYDINYQLALNEDKTTIFENYCDFLNYFDSSISVQLSFINQQVDVAEFEKSIDIPDQNDDFNAIRDEYRTMLKNQLSKGNNGLVKTKYITFGIEAESLKVARPRLERIETDILNNFKVLGAQAHSLNGLERLEILYHVFNQDRIEPFKFQYKMLPETGLKTKDFIAPTSFNFSKNQTFMMGRTMGSVSYLQILAPELTDRMLADFLDVDDSINVNIHIQSIDQSSAIKMIKSKISDLDKMKIEEQKRAVRSGYDMDVLPSDLVTYGEEAKNLLEDLQSRNERMFLVTFLVMNTAKKRQKLDNNIFQVQGIAQKYNCSLKQLDYQQEAALMVTWEEAADRIRDMYEDRSYVDNLISNNAIEQEQEEMTNLLALHFRDTSRNREEQQSYSDWQDVVREAWTDSAEADAIAHRFEWLQKDMDENPEDYRRWEIQHNPEYFQRFQDLQRERSWVDQKFTVERPALSFITQDEIDAVLRRGGITAGGRNRIYEYFMEHHDIKDAAEFLKNEYGTGGAAPGIPGAYESDASHDAKGLKLAKGKIGSPDVEVLLKWNKVAERVRQLIRTDDFLSPEELEKYEERQEAQRQADLEGAQQALEVEQEGSDQQEIREENQEPSEVETQPEAVEDAEKKEDITPEQSDIPATNFHITDDELGQGTPKEKFRANIMAIQLLKKCEEENRNATPDEQEILSRYVGWGGLADAFDETKSAWETEYLELKTVLTPEEYAAARASTLNAHYTQPIVIESMYQALENLGFTKGNILEPSMGVGNFFGMLPEKLNQSKLYGVELDSISGRIAKLLYPDANIQIKGFEKTDYPNDFFDVAIGNVPFGAYKVNDRQYDRYNFMIHDYFLAKTIDQLRPGGVAALITTKGTMDKASPEVRKYLAERADLLGAIRLPNTAFKANAGTEVSADILFFQKRDSMTKEMPEWVNLGSDANGITVNQYFADHPEMILGEMKEVSGPYGMETTCMPIEGADLEVQLAEAVRNIHGNMAPAVDVDAELDDVPESIPADPNVRNYSYAVVDDQVYYRVNSLMNQVKMPAATAERVKGMVEIRDTVRELIAMQMEESVTDEEIHKQQEKLNQVYDAYTAKYGVIGSNANKRAFSDDASYCLLCSLEDLNEDGTLKRKADMFTKRTIKKAVAVTSVETATEALALSLNERAKVDLSYMAQLTGKTEEKITEELVGVIFKNPLTDQWESGDEYLSGNVREKLNTARTFAENHPEFTPNVRALEAVQPRELEASEIEVRIGATWIEPSDYQDFMRELLHTPWYLAQKEIQVKYSEVNGEWRITGKNADSPRNAFAYATYGTERANAYRILEDTLNLKDVRIYDKSVNENGDEIRVLNKKETMLASQKQDAMKAAFKDWIFKDQQRRERLVRVYNERFNSIRPREYDGSHLTFPGMNPEIELRPHQKNAVAHQLYGDNVLLAHVVGAGRPTRW